MAPELLFPTKFGSKSARPTKPADIYALGMVIFEVLTGLQPFYEKRFVGLDILYHVEKGVRPTKPDNAEEIGFGGRTWGLVIECWMEEPPRRPTIKEVHAYLTSVATSSTVVGPTPKMSLENSPESDLAGKCLLFLAYNNSHLNAEGGSRPSNSMGTTTRQRSGSSANPTIFTNRTASTALDRTMSPVSTMNLTRPQSPNLHEKTNTVPLPISPENPHPSSSTSHNRHLIVADRRTILLEWQALKKTEPIDYQRLAQLIDVKENRNTALRFGRKDAAIVINTIDKVS